MSSYIHSFSAPEQQRLLEQAEFLEKYLYPTISFSPEESILEVGCGVGAQIRSMLRRFNPAMVTGVDHEPSQVEQALGNLPDEVQMGTVELFAAAGDDLPFNDNTFDGAYIFFVFEHLSDPVPIIREIRRVLKPGGRFYCTEVVNQGVYVYPHCPAINDYWTAFNHLQRDLGGNPNAGMHLASACIDAGLPVLSFMPVPVVMDKRMTDAAERKHFLHMWERCMLSGASALLERGMIAPDLPEKVSAEFEKLNHDPETIFQYDARQVLAMKESQE